MPCKNSGMLLILSGQKNEVRGSVLQKFDARAPRSQNLVQTNKFLVNLNSTYLWMYPNVLRLYEFLFKTSP